MVWRPAKWGPGGEAIWQACSAPPWWVLRCRGPGGAWIWCSHMEPGIGMAQGALGPVGHGSDGPKEAEAWRGLRGGGSKGPGIMVECGSGGLMGRWVSAGPNGRGCLQGMDPAVPHRVGVQQA
jgi:hypothetical protein